MKQGICTQPTTYGKIILQGGDTHYKKTNCRGRHPSQKTEYRGESIQKNIRVVDQDGALLKSTYEKRARQLAKKHRATWIASDTIMILQPEEDNDMECVFTEPAEALKPNRTDGVVMEAVINNSAGKEDVPNVESMDDKAILDLAKRRVNIKRNLIGQALDYCLLLFCMLLFVFSYSQEFRLIIAIGLALFWGIRLLARVLRFARPSFKDGIAAYIKERRERNIESEYNRLKRMNKNTVAELSK